MNEEAAPSYPNREFLRDIWSYIRPYKGRFLLASFLRFLSDLAALYPALAFAGVVTLLTQPHQDGLFNSVLTILIIWTITTIVNVLGRLGGRYMGYLVAERAGADALLAGITHLASLDTRWHEKEGSGAKLKRAQRGRDAITKVIRVWFSTLIQVAVDFAGTLIILSRTDLLTGGLFAVFVIIYLITALAFIKRATSATHHEGTQEERVQATGFEIIGNIRTVRALAVAPYLIGIIGKEITELYQRIKKRIFWFRTQAVALEAWFNFYKIFCFGLIAYGIIQGKFEIGFLVLFNAYFNRIKNSTEELAEVSQEIVLAKNNFWRLQETLKFPIRPGITAPEQFPDAWQHLTVHDISFGYYPDQPVLQNVSFTVRRGERIGIVGSSGAGKSTIFKLLLKEYDDFAGEILIDKVPVQKINEISYFKKVAVVLQDTEVFNLSLRENIITANPDQKDNAELFGHAVEVSHVKDFVHKLPQGYDTIIGEKGFKLSGGERQRLGIARAIFKKSDILLLDEATSHLDLESEEEIQDSLHHAFQHITAVVIAHRLTTIKEMDRILVIEDGKIIEEGSFDQLQAKRGRFFDLWEKQKL